MLKIEPSEAFTKVILSGEINEDCDFDPVRSIHAEAIHFFSGEVNHINSVAIKNWVRCLRHLKERGVRVTFFECSPAVVEQVNLVPSFLAAGQVESIHLPFFCHACDEEHSPLYTISQLKAQNIAALVEACPHCGLATQFDDLPEEYFSFLHHT